MKLAAAIELHGGGPGSGCHGDTCGRHGQHGNFKIIDDQQNGDQRSVFYRSTGGPSVVVNERGDGTHEVREEKRQGWVTTFSGDRGSALAHLSQRYGINHR